METGSDARRGMAGVGVDAAGLLAEFRTWLDRERGLSPESVRCYCNQAKAFLAASGGPEAVSGLDAGTVTAFMVEHSKDRNGWSAKAMVTSLRAFLRFAHATGKTAVPLAAAVPAVASWRLSALPRGLKAGEIERLLAGCDRDTVTGLRDYAVLSLLARLGLRGAEAARAPTRRHRLAGRRDRGHGQGQPHRAAPPSGPGREALATWLAKGRPACESRAVFVAVRRPYARRTDRGGGPPGHGPRLRPGWPGAVWRAPASSRAGDRDAARRRVAARGRAGAPAPQRAVHVGLCQGQPERAAPAGPAVAGAGQ